MQSELADVGIACKTLGTMRKSRFMWALFRKGGEQVFNYVQTHMRPVSRAEEGIALRFVIRIIIRRSPRQQGADRLVEVVQSFDRVASLMDDAYPGYAENGLLRWVLKRR